MHSSPSSAHAVAAATPCWPAPVSAITRGLPMRQASSACPSALLILCEPVCVRSSRLSQTWPPVSSDRRAVVERRGPAHVVAQQGVELVAVGGVGALQPGRLELVQRRDERLRHVAAAVGTEAPLDRRRAHAADTSAASAASTAWKNASSLAWSLRPGSASVPLAVSTANGRACLIARPTLSGVSPPESTNGGVPGCRRASPSRSLPGAARRARRVGVQQMEIGRERPERLHLRGVAHACGLHDLAAGAAGRLAAVGGPLVAVQLEQAEVTAVGQLRHLVERGVHEHPGEDGAPVELGSDQLRLLRGQARGLGQKIIPSAQAPRSTARRASAGPVIPQIFTRVIARLWSQAAPA